MSNENTQVAPPPAPAPSAALTPEQLQAKVAELEKQSEGRLRDLQEERRKRQELETKVNLAPSAPSPEPTDVKPKDELREVLNPYLKPVEERSKRAEQLLSQIQYDKSLEFMAQKTGKSKEAILADTELDNKLTTIVRRFKLNGDVYDVTKRAWEILELEDLRTKEAERRRVAEANGAGSSLPSGIYAPARASGKKWSEEEWNSMPLAEYEKLSSEGTFTQEKDGSIVFTPNPK